MSQFRPGDWYCSGCRNHNFARQSACRQCGMPRPMEGMGGGMDMGGGMGMGGGYGRPNDGPAPANFRPGDWMCQCGNHNFARNAYCRDCQAPKPMEGGYGAPPPMMGGAPPMMGGGGAGWRPGDWQCNMCRSHNFASRNECRECRAPKNAGMGGGGYGGGYGGGSGGSGWKPGDWKCTSCQYHNFAKYDSCRQCSTPRGDGASGYEGGNAQGGFLPGDWSCSCGEHNFAKRMTCRACNKPQPQTS